MPEILQRWLTLTEICTTLRMSPDQIKALVKKRQLVAVGVGQSHKRYLDPTPEYSERLRLAQDLEFRLHRWKETFPILALFTAREISYLTGWTKYSTYERLKERKIKGYRIGKYVLFSAETVRDILWRKSGARKRINKDKSPFLISELMRFFLEYKAREDEETPTDAEFAADELLQRKMSRMMHLPSPQREAVFRDFMSKTDFAKRFTKRAAKASASAQTMPSVSNPDATLPISR